jgi:hypothetical protein
MHRVLIRAPLAGAVFFAILGTTALPLAAQTTQPVILNDVLYGTSRANAAESVFHIRGDASTVTAATKLGSTWAENFLQGIQFDNTDGFRHAHFGNALAVDFGTAANGGSIFNLETRRTAGSGTPGLAQPVFDFPTYNQTNPPLTISRFGNVAVSPKNNRLAFGGTDSGSIYVLDYNNGTTPGTGVGASISNGRELTGALTTGSTSNTYSAAWLDNDTFLILNHPTNGAATAESTLKRVTIQPNGTLNAPTDVATISFGAGTAAFSSLAYEPNLSPYVYVALSQFTTATTNRLLVLDPNNNFAQVGSFDFSTTMNTGREIAFDSKGNLVWGVFGNTSSNPLGGSIDKIVGANVIANISNGGNTDYFTQDQQAALSAQFSGLDVAASLLDYQFNDVTVDVRDRKSVVRYFPGTVANPKFDIRDRLFTGYNFGDWLGTGSAITSTDARLDPDGNKAVGYVDAADLEVIGTEWFGVLVDGPATLVRYTYFGDTDLNGFVDGDDYARADNGFNTGLGDEWFEGDFDYNGFVDGDDYALIDNAFNTQDGTIGRAIAYITGEDRNRDTMNALPLQKVVEHFDEFGLGYANSFLSAIPEPTGAIAPGLAALLGLTPRRRRV